MDQIVGQAASELSQGSAILRGVSAAQVMGPGDTYLLHHELNIDSFWADKRNLALGACFKAAAGRISSPAKQMVSQVVPCPLWQGL